MKISEISDRTGISISALRYYEQQNLIRQVKRNDQGLRDYTEDDLKWILFLAAVKSARLSLNEIMEYANLYYSKNENFNDRLAVTERCRQKLVNEMKDIQEGIAFLDCKIAFYKGIIDEQQSKVIKNKDQ